MVPSKKRVQRICRAISDETGRDNVRLDPKTLVERLNRMLIGWANYFCVGEQSVRPTVRSICTPAGGCAAGSVTNTMSSDRAASVFRKRVFILCTVWFNCHTVPRVFRGRKRKSFRCGKSASPAVCPAKAGMFSRR